MIFFKDQITQSFNKEDSSMESLKDSEEGILAGEGEAKEDLDEEDKHSSNMDIHDLQERQLIEF